MVLKKKKAKKSAKRKPAVKRLAKNKVARKVIKRKAVKKTVKKKIAVKKPKEKSLGIVTHYFPHVQAAVIKLKAPLAVGDSIKIKGHTTDLLQNVSSMQIDRAPIQSAKKGDEIGLLVSSRVRQHDVVFKA